MQVELENASWNWRMLIIPGINFRNLPEDELFANHLITCMHSHRHNPVGFPLELNMLYQDQSWKQSLVDIWKRKKIRIM